MKILAIDTSTLTASAAVVIDDAPVAEEAVRTGTHSEVLMPLVARVMEWAGMEAGPRRKPRGPASQPVRRPKIR